MMKEKQLNVIFIECIDNYPNKFTANNSKVRLIADGLIACGARVSFVNQSYGAKQSSFTEKHVENINGIDVWSLPRFNKRKLGLLSNICDHLNIVRRLYRKDENNILVMGGPVFPFFLFFVFVYRLLGFNIGVMITEWAKDIQCNSRIKWFDNFLFANFFGYFVSMIFPISSFIIEKCRKFHKPMFKIPILASYPQNHPIRNGEKYFLLCSTLSYIRNVEIMIKSFDEFIRKGDYSEFKLKLVLSGSSSQMKKIYTYISKYDGLSIDIYNQIPYHQLLSLYNNACGLLIPLEDTNQDRARFSQKIAEYLSTGRPIITNGVGDINLYFQNNKDAYIAKGYNVKYYSEIMQRIADNPDEADRIGHEGFLLGKNNFDNNHVCKQLVDFLHQFE